MNPYELHRAGQNGVMRVQPSRRLNVVASYSWPHPARRVGGLVFVAQAARAGRVAGCAYSPWGAWGCRVQSLRGHGFGVLRRAIAPFRHTEGESGWRPLGANDSSIRRSPFLTVRTRASVPPQLLWSRWTTSHAPATIRRAATMELIGQNDGHHAGDHGQDPTKMYQPARRPMLERRSPMRSAVDTLEYESQRRSIWPASHTAAPLLKVAGRRK